MDKKITLTALLISSIAISGCSSSSQMNTANSASKKPRATVADIMKRQGSKTDIKSYRRYVSESAHQPVPVSMFNRVRGQSRHVPLMHYTRSEAKELKGIFPRLPNPDLCMYVYPHLSLEEATIPGYSSCFSLYDKNHYALPGEMPATLQANY